LIFKETKNNLIPKIIGHAMADGSNVQRAFSTTLADPDEVVTVTLSIVINGAQSYYAIEEFIPSEWTVVSDGGGSTSDPNLLRWVVYEGVVSTDYVYTVSAPSQTGDYFFSGNYQIEGMSVENETEGQLAISVGAACTITENPEVSCDTLDNDCDGQTDEMTVNDPNNCGSCNNVCNLPNTLSHACSSGQCQISNCDPGYVDANGISTDGCELFCTITEVTEVSCDGVDNDCDGTIDEGFTAEDCSQMCSLSGGDDYNISRGSNLVCCGNTINEDNPFNVSEVNLCDGRDNDCDGQVDEYPINDPNNCGSCGNVCDLPNTLSHGCLGNDCTISNCDAGWTDLNGIVTDGCEYVCVISEATELSCDGEDNDCDGFVDEMKANDPDNCGLCGNVCDLNNTFDHGCSNNVCTISSCDSGWSNLNGNATDGCEIFCTISNGGNEACDGFDNDCDGEIDEGFSAEECSPKCLAFNWDFNISRGEGYKCCGDNSTEANPFEDSETICDGFDNDCDGAIDVSCDSTPEPPPVETSSGGGGGGGGGSGGSPPACKELWSCEEWKQCALEGLRERKCVDKNNCGTESSKPVDIEVCSYVGDCKDGKMNGQEEGIDCGRVCGNSCEVINLQTYSPDSFEIIASPINAEILDFYNFKVELKNNGQETMEDIKIAFNKLSDDSKIFKKILSNEMITNEFLLRMSEKPIDEFLDVQVFYKDSLISTKQVPVKLSVPNLTLKVNVDSEKRKFYSVVIINNEGKDKRKVLIDYSILKEGKIYFKDDLSLHVLEEDEVYSKMKKLSLKLSKGEYEVISNYYEKDVKIGESITSFVVTKGNFLTAQNIFYFLIASLILAVIALILFYIKHHFSRAGQVSVDNLRKHFSGN